jgi:hypothetical protein
MRVFFTLSLKTPEVKGRESHGDETRGKGAKV